jgi:hypothetical protein
VRVAGTRSQPTSTSSRPSWNGSRRRRGDHQSVGCPRQRGVQQDRLWRLPRAAAVPHAGYAIQRVPGRGCSFPSPTWLTTWITRRRLRPEWRPEARGRLVRTTPLWGRASTRPNARRAPDDPRCNSGARARRFGARGVPTAQHGRAGARSHSFDHCEVQSGQLVEGLPQG